MRSRILALWSAVALTSCLFGCSSPPTTPPTTRPYSTAAEAADLQKKYDKIDQAFMSNSSSSVEKAYGSIAAPGFMTINGLGTLSQKQMLDQVALQLGVLTVEKASTAIRWSKDQRSCIYVESTKKIESLGKDGHRYQLTATFDDRWIRDGSVFKLQTQTSSTLTLLMEKHACRPFSSNPFPLSLSYPDPVTWSNNHSKTTDLNAISTNLNEIICTHNNDDIRRYVGSICAKGFYYSNGHLKLDALQFADRLYEQSKTERALQVSFNSFFPEKARTNGHLRSTPTEEEFIRNHGGQIRTHRLVINWVPENGYAKMASVREVNVVTFEASDVEKALIRSGKIK